MRAFEVIRLAACTGAGTAVTAFAYALISAPTTPIARLGSRGLRRQRAIGHGAFSIVEPLLRWCGTRLVGLVPARAHAWLDRQIVLAGDYLGLTPEEYAAGSVLCAALGLLSGLAYAKAGGALAGVVVFTVVGGLTLYIQVGQEAARRARDISRGLPYAIDLLALAMSAGLDFPGAVRQIVVRSSNKESPLVEELERILRELSVGHTRREALESFAERTEVPAVAELVSAVVQSEKRGNPLADTLVIQAKVSRQKRSATAEELAAKSATLMYVPLALLVVATLIVVGGPLVLRMKEQML